MTHFSNERRYDIDWLRTLAFAVLILYHIGMYYVADWGWHIKSEHSSVLLQDIMILTNPWRMSLLFFIGAIALSMVQQRYSAWQLLRLRSTRLMIPLLFGMFVVVVPQVYYEALSQDLIKPGYLTFWRHYINPHTDLLREHHSAIGLLTWNHLWFLPYLWCYSLILLALATPLRRLTESAAFQNISGKLALCSIIILLTVLWQLLRQRYPVTNALVNDWYNHGKYFSTFVFGYLFARQLSWWRLVIAQRRVFLLLALLGYGLLIADRHEMFPWLASQFDTSVLVQLFYRVVLALNHWAWIFSVVGYAGQYLNRPSALLSYSNKAILPWYILHQTLIIVFAWWLKPLHLSMAQEAPLLLLCTVSGCLLGYEIIRRLALLRWFCGLQVRLRQADANPAVASLPSQ